MAASATLVRPQHLRVAAPAAPVRLRSLDGLRGAAAAVVLLHHLSLSIPAVSSGYDSASALAPFSFAWWAVASPLKILVAGPEFVLVFFVLSGFVLTLTPFARHDESATAPWSRYRGYNWVSYYPRRILRLGIPVVASLVLAVGVITALPRATHAGESTWLVRQAHPDLSVHHLIAEALMIVDPNRPGVNSSLWSLTWEMWFSLLLPVAIVVALWSRRAPGACVALLLGVSVLGYLTDAPAAQFLPAFGLGALLGANAHRVRACVQRCCHGRWVIPVWLGIAVAGPMLSICYWLLRPLLGPVGVHLALAMRVPGALLMVATVAFWPAAARVFESKPLAWLGRISFSLYLVQAPIVVGVGLAFAQGSWWVGAIITLVGCFCAALVMYALVEKPSRRLASLAGRAASRAVKRLRGQPDSARQ